MNDEDEESRRTYSNTAHGYYAHRIRSRIHVSFQGSALTFENSDQVPAVSAHYGHLLCGSGREWGVGLEGEFCEGTKGKRSRGGELFLGIGSGGGGGVEGGGGQVVAGGMLDVCVCVRGG